MKNRCLNIYKKARVDAKLTREEAVELLHVSIRSLADYESGKTIPGCEVVCLMAEAYRADWLGYKHLKYSTEVGKRYLPELELTDLARSVLKLQKEVSDVTQINGKMIEVACDGVVEEHETEKWQKVQKEISEMAAAAMAVLFHQKEKKAHA